MDNKEKIISLYKFIKDLVSLKMRIVTEIDKQAWAFELKDIPEDIENISLFYRDRVESEDSSDDDVLLRIHKPEYQACPAPDRILVDWLEDGWDIYYNRVKVKNTLTLITDAEVSDDAEHFNNSVARVHAFEKWVEIRNKWADKQIIISRTRKLFTRMYQLHTDLERDSETTELIIGEGILNDRNNTHINHPVLLRRVKTSFDARNNTIYVHDTDTESELYTIVFQEMTDINHQVIKSLNEELKENDYHPLDRNDAHEFLKMLVYRLSSESKYAEKPEDAYFGSGDRLLLQINPMLFIRKRIDGALKAIDQIIESIEGTGYIPPHLIDIVNGGLVEIPDVTYEATIENQLAAVGGEDIDILLSKEANKEQLEIAQRIEYYNAVLVQGPPGTGKTHTIANLLGHFLAQGKSVLVTSQTKKALSVLKEKIVPGLKNLCVSVLDDSNTDMERSVDGISDFLSRNTSNELKKKMEAANRQRSDIINTLADVRKKIYTIKFKEFEPIVINGDSVSPSEAAKYVNKHTEMLSYIPGKVTLYHALPLTFEELAYLYRSNEEMTADEEQELKRNLPNPQNLTSPSEFKGFVDKMGRALNRLHEYENRSVHAELTLNDSSIQIISDGKIKNILNPTSEAIQKLKEYISSFKKIEGWMIYAAVDGRKGGTYKSRWNHLIDQIENTRSYAESLVEEQFGYNISISDTANIETLSQIILKMKDIFDKKGKITKIDRLLNKNFEIVENNVFISGRPLSSSSDCSMILHQIELIGKRKKCASYWDDLISVHDVPLFDKLDEVVPEDIAANWIKSIKRYLSWYENEYKTLCILLESAGVNLDAIFESDPLDSEVKSTQKILFAVGISIPEIIDICEQYFVIQSYEKKLSESLTIVLEDERKNSATCKKIAEAICHKSYTEYEAAYSSLVALYNKYAQQQKRSEYINRLYVHAPEWAESIKARDGIHGLATVPIDIEDAWKWKQYAGIITDITAKPFEELQAQSVNLSKSYRKKTATLAELSAWHHLLLKTERNLDMKQALQGWKLTVRKIGKGTGKNAPMLKAEARKLMAKCQRAVPAWIMPVNKALESLDPRKNQFDIIIIDEASQSDISALSIAYMAKKIIIVGDDKQVSPMAVGVDIDRMNNLIEMYIKNVIPNWHLFNATSSLYDIAGTTFQPLMLREHFRCVPDIIGFSNKLSYDFKIKPLRDTGNCTIFPAVVNYRVDAGERDAQKKTNLKEAKSIVALMMACMEQPEYDCKTFGVISLLGDEQARLVQNILFDHLEPSIIDTRRILCGNASHFQGDERDVIFLSMVDSNFDEGPLKMLSTGMDESNKKRYNVAVSRAKDQLWVVNSLDASKDLKSGDIRKELLEYARNPRSYAELVTSVEKQSESPFEEEVGKRLVAKGYHIVQQWKVGAYRIDMVVVYGNQKIAVECDGEKYHSGEDKVREDMERQTILERLGWHFIRIRGSEYYRNPDKTMERVIEQIEQSGIHPENVEIEDLEYSTELLERAKIRAIQLLDEWNNDNSFFDETSLKSEFAFSIVTDKVNAMERKTKFSSEKSTSNLPFLIGKTQASTSTKELEVEHKRSEPRFDQLELFSMNNHTTSNKPVQINNEKATTGFMRKRTSKILKYLDDLGAEYIDNSDRSSIIWVICKQCFNVKFAKDIEEKFTVKCQYERRGSKATNNHPAWRINL